MRAYEGMFVVDDGKATDDFQGVVNHIRGLMERHGAAIKSLEKWDSRRLAYEIRGRKRGTYLLSKFDIPPANVAPLRRDCQISSIILRCLFLVDENIGTVLESTDEFDSRDRHSSWRDRRDRESQPPAEEADAAAEESLGQEPNEGNPA